MSENTKKAFVELGKFLNQFSTGTPIKEDNVLNNDIYFENFISLIEGAQNYNRWFTPEQVYFAINSWAKALKEDNLNNWLSKYNITNKLESKIVGLVLAGNIPLVGFHDFLSVIITGHKALIKNASDDNKLLPFLAQYLISAEPTLKDKIVFTNEKLENFDAVIATGSNNTARYFEYYFSKKPNIIRKNRNSIAILNGNESIEDLENLGEDIFRYYGLGCRNVSKLYVPKNYNFDNFFKAIFKQSDIIHYEKYANNYDYNKAVFLMSNFKILDNGFLTLKEDSGLSSPISSVFYEYYDNLEELKQLISSQKENLQCIVSNNLIEGSIAFGQTQNPKLWDYADGVDTIAFLTNL